MDLHGGGSAKDGGRKDRDNDADQQHADDNSGDPKTRAIDRGPDRGEIERKHRILAVVAVRVGGPYRLRDAAAVLAHADISIRSEDHTSELQSLMRISYAVLCLKKKNKSKTHN